MNYKTIFITGATDGIGKITASQIAVQQVQLLIHGRNRIKTNQLVEQLKKETANELIEGYVADLSSLKEVRQLAEQVLEDYDRIDVLINNAGVGFADPRYSMDGYELRLAVNYLVAVSAYTPFITRFKKSSAFTHRECKLCRATCY